MREEADTAPAEDGEAGDGGDGGYEPAQTASTRPSVTINRACASPYHRGAAKTIVV